MKAGRTVLRLVVAATLLLAGCASMTSQEDDTLAADPRRPAALDLVAAMVQVPILNPDDIVVQFDRPTTGVADFGSVLVEAMEASGYAIESVTDTASETALRYTISRVGESDASVTDRYELSVAGVGFRRDYTLRPNGELMPLGSMFVRGVDASTVALDDSRFVSATPQSNTNLNASRDTNGNGNGNGDGNGEAQGDGAAQFSPPSSSVIADNSYRSPAASLMDGSIDESVAAPDPEVEPLASSGAAPLIAQVTRRARTGANTLTTPIRPFTANTHELGRSNFADLLSGYVNLEEQVLVFDNDSLRLGTANKSVIDSMVEKFDDTRDVFAIVGCSLGYTNIENGNEVLALGRANRVKEALLFAGVPQGRILDEGCWAGEVSTSMPSRGVVLTLKRERAG